MKKVLMTLAFIAAIAGYSVAQTTPQKEKGKTETKKEEKKEAKEAKEAKHAKHHHAKVTKHNQ